MRFSEAWLREFVDPPIDTARLVHQLTMAGLEVEGTAPAAGEFMGVVVGAILGVAPHPQADRLRVCRVDIGNGEPLQIVCGAPNARPGLRAPLALEGAELPGGMKIGRSELRGVASFGMLCSARELRLADDVSGLMELPADAPIGTDLREYLQLDDTLIEVDLTPNRADCLSVQGIAREVAVLNGLDAAESEIRPVKVTSEASFPVVVVAPDACPRYLGRVIEGVSRNAESPLWMKERLRRSGLRSLDPVVDVTNYVLLEQGQPLHAFDLAKLEGCIRVRFAEAGERLSLLNGQELELHDDVLVIADDCRALAVAGIMGGSESAVGETTHDIFLECAFFSPHAIMGKARRYGLNTDSSHRFERGVDFSMQERAIERTSELILAIAGGQAGPLVKATSVQDLPRREPILLREERIQRLLGISIDSEQVEGILSRLRFLPERVGTGWRVIPPGFRFDLAIEADLIEELGRVYGYDRLPRRHPVIPAAMRQVSEEGLELDRAKNLLVDRGYQEAITYSFVEERVQRLIEPKIPHLALRNPISAELAVMRTSLWVGLLDAALKNLYRQQDRVRLFETGYKFRGTETGIEQLKSVAGLALGSANPEQWGEALRPLDFYDIKADVEALVHLTGRSGRLSFAAGSHPALHPGQTAEIRLDGIALGWLGMLHPNLEQQLGFEQKVFLFELDQDRLLRRTVPHFRSLSKFPGVRRDIAVIVDEAVTADRLVGSIRREGEGLLREVRLFDVYRGPGVESGKKSVALGLFWQDEADTLQDARVDSAMAKVLECLVKDFEARLRD